MPLKKYTVYGYVTFSAFAHVEVGSAEEAKRIFEGLSAPSLCHQCANAGAGPGEVTLNGPDDNTVAVEVLKYGK